MSPPHPMRAKMFHTAALLILATQLGTGGDRGGGASALTHQSNSVLQQQQQQQHLQQRPFYEPTAQGTRSLGNPLQAAPWEVEEDFQREEEELFGHTVGGAGSSSSSSSNRLRHERKRGRLLSALRLDQGRRHLLPGLAMPEVQSQPHSQSSSSSSRLSRRSVSFRTKEKQILDEVLGQGVYDKRIRPAGVNSTDLKSSTIVNVNIYLRSINDIDDYKMEYSVQITFREQWNDERLKFDDLGGKLKYLTLTDPDKVWMPDTFFRNEKVGHFHAILVNNVYVRVFPNGDVLFSIRISLTLACPMNLKLYPMDRQTCSLKIASYGYTTDDITYLWERKDPVQIPKGLSLPRFSIEKYSSSYCNVKTNTGEYSCLSVDLVFKRQFSYYLITIYVPGCMLVIVSWVSFWLDPHAVPARVALGVTTLLTMSTQTASINSALPPVAYTKAIDVWQGVCVTFVFSALLEYALVNYALRANRTYFRLRGIGFRRYNDDGDDDGEEDDEEDYMEEHHHQDMNGRGGGGRHNGRGGGGRLFDDEMGLQRRRSGRRRGGGTRRESDGGGGSHHFFRQNSTNSNVGNNLLFASMGNSAPHSCDGGGGGPVLLGGVGGGKPSSPHLLLHPSQRGTPPPPTPNTAGTATSPPPPPPQSNAKLPLSSSFSGALTKLFQPFQNGGSGGGDQHSAGRSEYGGDNGHRNALLTSYAYSMERAKRIDVVSRVVFPAVFAVFNLSYWIYYLIRAAHEFELSQKT